MELGGSIALGHVVIPPGPKGEKPSHPHARFGLLAWGYLHGVRSSRKLARLARQEATFVALAGGGAPPSRTLARFRRDTAAAFPTVFQATVVLALRLGLAKLGHVALDGTKLRAHTSKHKAMRYGWMQRREAQLKDEIARLVARAAAQDVTEDQAYGADSDGSSVDEELARREARCEARLAKIQTLRTRLEAEQRVAQGLTDDQPPTIEDKAHRSFADGDARMLLLKRGDYGSASTAQAAVAATSGVIVAADLTNVAPDEGHLPAVGSHVRPLRAAAGRAGAPPPPVRAAAGSFSPATAAEDGEGSDRLSAAGRDDPAARAAKTGTVCSADRFGDDPAADAWGCPAGTRLVRQVTAPGAMGRPAKNR